MMTRKVSVAVDPDRQRQRAAALANALQPLIENHLASEPPPPPVMLTIDRHLLAACASVERAVEGFEQAKFTPSEINARRKIMEAAMKVRTLMRKRRERRNGR